jgi:hypothetical protein
MGTLRHTVCLGLTSEGSDQRDRVGMGVRPRSSRELPGWTLPVAALRGRSPKQPADRVFRLLSSQLVGRLVQVLAVVVQVNGLHLGDHVLQRLREQSLRL